MPDGFDPLGFFVGVGNFLSSLLGSLIAFINAVLSFLLRLTLFIFQVVVIVVRFLGRAFPAVFRGVRHVISDIIHGRFVHLFEDYLRLKEKLRKFFEPVLRIIRRIRQIYDLWFRRTILPILNMIQQLRQVLQIFRIFHLRFAERLDARLLQVEARIFETWNTLRIQLNRVSSIIELIVDPSLFIRQRVMIGRAIRSIGTLVHVLDRATQRPLTKTEDDSQRAARQQFRVDVTRSRLRERGATGPTQADKERAARIRVKLEEITGVKLGKP